MDKEYLNNQKVIAGMKGQYTKEFKLLQELDRQVKIENKDSIKEEYVHTSDMYNYMSNVRLIYTLITKNAMWILTAKHLHKDCDKTREEISDLRMLIWDVKHEYLKYLKKIQEEESIKKFQMLWDKLETIRIIKLQEELGKLID